MRGFGADESGNTRIAVALATGVLLVLAVAAVPLVMGHGRNAQDNRAQTAVAGVASAVEACRLSASSYRDCDESAELDEARAVRWGRGPGEAGVLDERSDERSFTAYAVSASRRHVYVWISRDSRVAKHTCGHGSVDRLEAEGCDGPGW